MDTHGYITRAVVGPPGRNRGEDWMAPGIALVGNLKVCGAPPAPAFRSVVAAPTSSETGFSSGQLQVQSSSGCGMHASGGRQSANVCVHHAPTAKGRAPAVRWPKLAKHENRLKLCLMPTVNFLVFGLVALRLGSKFAWQLGSLGALLLCRLQHTASMCSSATQGVPQHAIA